MEAPDPGAYDGTGREAPVRRAHLGTAQRPRQSTNGRTATHRWGGPSEQQVGPMAARGHRVGNRRPRNAGETIEDDDNCGGCGCMWTEQRRRWTNVNHEFRNLSHKFVLGALRDLSG